MRRKVLRLYRFDLKQKALYQIGKGLLLFK